MASTTSVLQTSLSFMAIQALAEIHRVFNRAELSKQDPRMPIVKEIMKARDKVIVLHGVGREGLIIRGFAMRLFHLGLRQVYMFGDMCTPLMKEGDLLIVTSGPGWPSSADPIITEATASGARALVITAKADGAAAALATTVALIPAQTIADPDFPTVDGTDVHPECTMMVEGKIPWQLAHGNRKASQVPQGDPMAALPPAKPKVPQADPVAAPPAAKAKLSTKPGETLPIAAADAAARGSQLGASLRDSQLGTSIRESQLGTSIRESQLGTSLRESQLGASLRESQLGASIRGSQIGISLHPPEPARFIVTDNKFLPMGSAYEGALFILLEIVVYMLREMLQETLPMMRGRNTNLDHFPPSHTCEPPPPPPPPPPLSPPPPDDCGRDHDRPPTADSGVPPKGRKAKK